MFSVFQTFDQFEAVLELLFTKFLGGIVTQKDVKKSIRKVMKHVAT